MTDRQRDRVYRWEGQWCDWVRGTLTLAECRAVIKWACAKYGIPPPIVRQHDGKADSFSQGALISFQKGQKNPAVALHEVAHYVTDLMFGNDIEHHAPEWMAVYLWLLEAYRVAPRHALHASAKAAGLRWIPTWVVSPKRMRRGR